MFRVEKKSIPVFVLVAVVTVVISTSLYLFHQSRLHQEKENLVTIVESQARLIESVARLDSRHSQHDHPEGSRSASLCQVIESQKNFDGWGKSGEFTLAEVNGGVIKFLDHLRFQDNTEPLLEVTMGSANAKPMQLALQRKSGILIDMDYRGEKVLAAYEWLDELEVGLVAKIDLSEVHASFLKEVTVFSLIALLLMSVGSVVYFLLNRIIHRSLRETEVQMQLLLDSSGEGIFGINNEGSCIFANPMCARLTGYDSTEELLSRNMHGLIHHHHADGSIYPIEKCSIVEALRSEVGVHVDDEVFWRKDGSCFPVEYHSYPIKLEGSVVGAVVNFSDISERKQAEENNQLIGKVSQICLQADDHKPMLEQVLDIMLEHFDCDRAWALYPCDPDAPEWEVPVERTRPEWPRIFVQGKNIPMDAHSQTIFRNSLANQGALVFDETGGWSAEHIPLWEMFSVQSLMVVVLTPKFGKPWLLGIHHCAKAHCFSEQEQMLLERIAERVSEALGTLLSMQDLVTAKNRLADSQHMAHIGNWELDLINNQLYWSDEIFHIFDIDKEKFGASYDAFLNAIHPDDREMVNAAYAQSLEDKSPYEITHRLLIADGRVKYVNERCETFYDETGQAIVSSGTVQDITENIERENKLKENEIKFSRIFHGSNDAIIIHDLQGSIIEVNEKAEIFLGYTSDELKSMKLSALHPPEALNASKEAFDKIMRDGEVYFEIDFLTKAERIFPAEISSAIIEFNGKQFVQGLIRDISERKNAEDLLRKSESLLREAESIGKLGGWEWDITNDVMHWSDEVHNIFGVPPGELNFEIFMQCVHPDDRAMLDEQLDAGTKGKGVFEYVFRIIHPDGEIKTLRSRAEVRFDENNRPVRLVGVTQDLTEQKAAEDELAKYRQHLEELVAARTRDLETTNKELNSFSYSVSHDLRAPLRAINGFSHALLEDYQDKLDETGRDYLQRVSTAAQRMGDLIDDMLSLSKVTRHGLQFQTVNMSAMAVDIMTELKDAFPDRAVELKLMPDVTARGDLKLLRIAMSNLLGNAWKYTSKNECSKIEFGFELRDDEKVYYVRDNGVGFDMIHSAKLFGAFQRLHGCDEFEGTGIGLATVQRIINRHGGRIWAEAEVGNGACFYFELGSFRADVDK